MTVPATLPSSSRLQHTTSHSRAWYAMYTINDITYQPTNEKTMDLFVVHTNNKSYKLFFVHMQIVKTTYLFLVDHVQIIKTADLFLVHTQIIPRT